jgi:hypothetical protein
MDTDRRDLYVEGVHDKMVLEFLCGDKRDQSVRIIPIDDALYLPCSQGGTKGRLLALAKEAEQKGVQNLRFLVDRDFDSLIGVSVPSNTWQTDMPDFEGYLFTDTALSKALRISYCDSKTDASWLLNCVVQICRQLGLLHFLSRRDNLQLPIVETKKRKCVVLKDGSYTFDMSKFVTMVLQNAGISLSKMTALLADLECITETFRDTPSLKLVRGKDFMEISAIILGNHNIKEFSRVLWATLDKNIASYYPTLASVMSFLSARVEP